MTVRPLRLLVSIVAVVVTATLLAGILTYHRQIWSYLTHRKGGPTQTEPYEPPAASPRPVLRLAGIGDIGDSGGALDATADAMADIGEESPFDVLLILGDNVYPNGDPERLPETVFQPFARVFDQGAILLAIVGNHDVRTGNGDAQMAALGMTGRWWSRQMGDVLIVGLDSTDPENPEQLDFLTRILEETDARWKIVALHHPPYSAGYHGSNTTVRRTFAPVFERYGVQLVLSGHEHDYQRSKEIDGVTYVVSGAGSGTRRTGEAGFTAVSWSSRHFVDITVYEDRLLLRAVDADRRVADETDIDP